MERGNVSVITLSVAVWVCNLLVQERGSGQVGDGFVNRCYLPVGNHGCKCCVGCVSYPMYHLLTIVPFKVIPFGHAHFKFLSRCIIVVTVVNCSSVDMNCGPKQFSMHMCKSKSLSSATVIRSFSLFIVG